MARLLKEEYVVHGKTTDSINEFNVAMALEKFHLDYEYQYYFGLSRIKSSQVIDFLVKTAPKPTPVNVHGTYWHSGRYAPQTVLNEQAVNVRMRGTWADEVIIWENECEDIDSAIEAVGRKLGVG